MHLLDPKLDVVFKMLFAEPRNRALLARIFDDFELRKFVEEMEDPELNASLLDTDVRFDAVVSQFVATLGRRGRIDQDLFAALEAARPNKAAEIREVARLALPAKESYG